MISKYDNTCKFCHQRTRAGVDQYDPETKTAYHADCEPKEGESQEDMAERLGYKLASSWEELP